MAKDKIDTELESTLQRDAEQAGLPPARAKAAADELIKEDPETAREVADEIASGTTDDDDTADDLDDDDDGDTDVGI